MQKLDMTLDDLLVALEGIERIQQIEIDRMHEVLFGALGINMTQTPDEFAVIITGEVKREVRELIAARLLVDDRTVMLMSRDEVIDAVREVFIAMVTQDAAARLGSDALQRLESALMEAIGRAYDTSVGSSPDKIAREYDQYWMQAGAYQVLLASPVGVDPGDEETRNAFIRLSMTQREWLDASQQAQQVARSMIAELILPMARQVVMNAYGDDLSGFDLIEALHDAQEQLAEGFEDALVALQAECDKKFLAIWPPFE